MNYSTKHVERFWAKTDKGDVDDCWLWTDNLRKGYGRLRVGKVQIRAHRFSWELHYGVIPDRLKVCHACDNPACVNPKHLFLGTDDDNVKDKVTKGRQARGETGGQSKLTWDKVKSIRTRYAQGGINQYELAAEYGVKQVTIWNVIHHNTWKDE